MVRHERRSSHPGDPRNWALDCQFPGCGRRFRSDETVGQLAEHWNTHEGKTFGEVITVERDKPHLLLTWIGVGQPPEGRPSWAN